MNTSRWASALLGLGVLALAGCGGAKSGEVSGPVTLKNEPLAEGVVTFFPKDGVPVAVYVMNGQYSIASLPYGSYRVSVTAGGESPAVGGSGKPAKPGEVDPTARAAAAPKKANGPQIPPKYLSADTSGLACAVEQAKITFPISLD